MGLGAVLKQKGKPVAYASRLLKGPERNYGITEREALAMIWAMERFRYFLLGRKFVVKTDHKALEEIRRKKEFGSKRIQRWLERIDEFDFEIDYVPGVYLVQADAMSRSLESDIQDLEAGVLELHESTGHRKQLKDVLKEKKGVVMSEKKIREILTK